MVTETGIKQELILIKSAIEDPKNFEPIYEKYFEEVFRFVQRRMNNMDESADVTQEIFIKVMLNLHKFEYKGFPFSAWLFRIAYNEVNTFFRKNTRKKEVYYGPQDLAYLLPEFKDEIEDKILFEVRWESVVNSFNVLKPDQVKLIELRFMDKRTYKEIAQMTNMTEANAKIKVFRALKKLKTVLLKEHNFKN